MNKRILRPLINAISLCLLAGAVTCLLPDGAQAQESRDPKPGKYIQLTGSWVCDCKVTQTTECYCL